MSVETHSGLATLVIREEVAHITLNRPQRRNSLTPELLETLNARFDEAAANAVSAIVLAGAGETFSSGGDVATFSEYEGAALEDYADRVVSLLNRAILKMLAAPIPIVARLQGFATGGAAGFIFASDIVVIAKDAYIAPYYSVVGFSPDGGWTALLPERIGTARALEIQFLNQRISAEEALRLGLVSHIASPAQLDKEIDRIVGELKNKSKTSLAQTKRLIWTAEKLSNVESAIEAERRAFVLQIGSKDTKARMESFLQR